MIIIVVLYNCNSTTRIGKIVKSSLFVMWAEQIGNGQELSIVGRRKGFMPKGVTIIPY